MSWIVYTGPVSTFTVAGTPIYIEGELIAVVPDQDWASALEVAAQKEVDETVAIGKAYTEARARGEI